MSTLADEIKRSPGRPKQSLEAAPIKKGSNSWQPASVTDVVNKEEGFRYRWLNKSPENLSKKKVEKWEILSGLQSDKSSSASGDKGLSSVIEKHDVILARISEENALQRDDYFNKESQRRVAGLTAHVKKELGKEGAGSHGKITISSRKGEETIE